MSFMGSIIGCVCSIIPVHTLGYFIILSTWFMGSLIEVHIVNSFRTSDGHSSIYRQCYILGTSLLRSIEKLIRLAGFINVQQVNVFN